MSTDVNVTLHVAPLAVTVRVSHERDRNPKLRHTHCANFDVLLMGLFSVHAPHCERLSEAMDGFQTLAIRFNVISPFSSNKSNCQALVRGSCSRIERRFVIRGQGTCEHSPRSQVLVSRPLSQRSKGLSSAPHRYKERPLPLVLGLEATWLRTFLFEFFCKVVCRVFPTNLCLPMRLPNCDVRSVRTEDLSYILNHRHELLHHWRTISEDTVGLCTWHLLLCVETSFHFLGPRSLPLLWGLSALSDQKHHSVTGFCAPDKLPSCYRQSGALSLVSSAACSNHAVDGVCASSVTQRHKIHGFLV